MPRCDNCQYLIRTSYEYGEYTCEIFGDNDEGCMFTENGCRYQFKTLEKYKKKNDEILKECFKHGGY